MKPTSRLMQLAAAADAHLHEFMDLGVKEKPYVPCPLPAERKTRIHYPTLYISGREDKGIFDLPPRGKAMVSYVVKSRTQRAKDGDDREGSRYSTDIEIRTFDPVKKAGSPKNLEALLEPYEFDRARDGAGRYAQGDEPPSPGDMATVYQKRKKKALVGGGLAAAAAGASAVPGVRRAAGRLGQGVLRSAMR